jgi:hypothetical protein
MTGSATLGHDLADSLYSELYGLRQVDGQRRSPHANQNSSGCCFVRPYGIRMGLQLCKSGRIA